MEKGVPHGKLSAAKTLIRSGKVRTTFSARAGAAALGLDVGGILKMTVIEDVLIVSFKESES